MNVLIWLDAKMEPGWVRGTTVWLAWPIEYGLKEADSMLSEVNLMQYNLSVDRDFQFY